MDIDKKIQRTYKLAQNSFWGVIKLYLYGRGKLVFEVGNLSLRGRISEKMLYMYVNDYTLKIRIKDLNDSKFILNMVKMILLNGKEIDKINFDKIDFNFNKFFENLNDFNNDNNFKFVGKKIDKSIEIIKSFNNDFDYKSSFPIYKDFIEIKDDDLNIYVPVSYFENPSVEDKSIIVQFVCTADKFEYSDKRIKKVIKWLKKYKSSYPE